MQFIDVENVNLLNKVSDMKNEGYRLAQICATKLDRFILLYSFVKNGELVTLRVHCEFAEPVESVSWLYSYAFLYENEMKDLFGLNILNMSVDFNGHFYETSVQTPFNPPSNLNESEAADNG